MTVSVLAALVAVVNPTAAYAAGTVLFQNSFADRTVDGTGTVTIPSPPSGQNTACLTASGNSATPPLLSCAGAADAQGSGKLRFTSIAFGQVGGVFGQGSFPTSNGLDVTFTSYQWGGVGTGADGLAFMLAAVDPANPAAPTAIGSSGGALGYSAAPGVVGLTNAYLGVGLDEYGNFSNIQYSGTGCPSVATISVRTPGAVVVRGPGSARVGYCGLATTSDGTTSSALTLRAVTRAASAVPVQVLINPTSSAFTSDSGVSVSSGTYKVVVTPVGQSTRTLTGALPAATGLYPSTSWLGPNGVPKQLAFGFVGSTGSVSDTHEISNAKVLTFNPVPQLSVSSTGYSTAAPQPGDPVTYTVAASVLAGANETSPISVTQTVPDGVAPLGAYGTGWVCQSPVGKTVTCTTTASSFPNGTALPVITVVAVVTASGVTSTLVQTASTARAASTDASPGADSTTTAGTLPTTPSAITVTPATGPVGGGGVVTVGGTAIAAATAIEIGTSAEQQAGTPVTLLPCAGAAAPGCFTVSGGNLVISSMPARAASATVSVTVVTAGVAAAASYTYAALPAAPATPTATAGVTSATLTWTAPASNGSPITGYVVTPYLTGVAQPQQTFDASTTTRTFASLTAGASYTFTVAAVNAYGTSSASPKSAAVVPYALPGAPTITAATAGSLAATLTWTTPANGGSAITGYVVTPYVGTVAQAAQTFTGTATTATVTGLTGGTTYTFTVAAQNQAGTGPASAPSPPVTPNQSPSLTFAAPPGGEVGVVYSAQLAATGGTSPFVWSVTGGTLPAGLTLAPSTGLLAGTPTAAGSFPFTIRVVDASSQAATKAVTLVIAAAPALTFAPPAGEVGVPYNQQPTLTGGTGPFTWAVSAGSLPVGLAIDRSTGLVSGTPTTAGAFTATIGVTDAANQVASKTVTLTIVARPAFTAGGPVGGQVGVAYSTSFPVTGGAAPLTWSVSAGSVPAGLTFEATTGVLSGVPTTAASSSFSVSVVDANGQTATRTATLVIATGPLVITKTANVSSAAAGGVVAYTILVTNTGSSAFTGVAVSDPLTGVLDDAAYNANASATSGTLSYTTPNLAWTGTVAPAGSVTIGYSVTVNNPDMGNKVLSNTVTSATLGTNCAAASTDARCSATVTVPGLTIVKTADSPTATPGSTVGFSIVVTNTGPTAYAGATLTDSLAGVLDDATYNADGRATSGNVSYTSPSLTWTGSLGVGASATITYSVTVANPDAGDRSLTGTVVSPSAGSPCPAVNPAAQCTATVTVLVPALSITSSAAPSSATPGATVVYTVTLSNTGQTAYSATSVTVAIAAALDDATYDGNATASAGSVAFNQGTASLVWTGDLPVGGVVTLTASVTVRSPDPGDRTLTSVTTSGAPGNTCLVAAPNPACTTTVQVRIPALTISTAADVSTTSPGSVVHQTISVTNNGQTPYSGATLAAALGGELDDATYNGDAASTVGVVTATAGAITWTGDLLVGASATITFSVTVADPDNGDRTLRTTVISAAAGANCPAAGTDPRCTSSVAVLIPGLTITPAVDAASTTPGAVVHYTVTVVNTGQTTYSGLAVTLDLGGALDDADYNYDAAITTGSLVTNPDGTVDWVLDLAPGASATGTVSLTVHDPDAGDRSLRVAVVSDAKGSPCPTGSTATACSSVLPVLVPGLVVTKTAGTSTVTPGGTVGYTVSVVNTGETTYPAASFTDDLSTVLTDATYAGGATATTGTVSYAAPVLSWTGGLAPGASATISYSVAVRDPDPGDKRLINTVVSASAGTNCPAGSADPRCTAAVNVLVPGLTIVTTASSPTTTPGATVGHTIAVTNSGATALTAVAVADSLAGVLDDATYGGDAATTTGTLGYANSTLTWTGNLAIGATATITYSVTVHAADGGDNLLTSTVTSATAGSNCAAGSADGRCTTTVRVARLILAFVPTDPTTTPGSVVALSATYTNTGQVPYTGISVDVLAPDAADDGLAGGQQTASSGTLVLGQGGATWTGSIPVGGVVTVGATMLVNNPDLGNKIIVATMQSAAAGNNCPAGAIDSRCTVTITVLVPELTITKTASATATVPGGSVGYTITVHNTGQTPYAAAAFTDSLSGVLDKASYNNDATATLGVVSFGSPTLSWTGALAVGATATISYTVTASSAPTGDKTMVNSVGSSAIGSTCPPGSGSAACRSSVAILTPALTITKTADVPHATLGTTVTFTVTATNTGQVPYPVAAFTDPLAGVLDDATYQPTTATATAGTLGYADGVLSWSGALAPRASATVTYAVTVNETATGDRTMVNTVSSVTPGSTCASGAGDTRCTATVAIINAVTLTFTKTAGVASTVAGGVVAYTVTVTNSSESPVIAANFTDPLAGVVDDATYNGDASASGGATSYTSPNLTWSGTVPALSTVTVTYSVTVHATVTGDQLLTGTVASTALPTSDNCVAGSTDPRCTSTVPVAALLIEQHYTETSTTPGSVVHLSATFTNTGKYAYTGITIASPGTDTVDDANPNGDQAASTGTLVLSATAITWTGNIPVGGVVTVGGTLTVKDPDPGNRVLTGTLVSAAPGSNCPAGGVDSRCTARLPVLQPGLTITKTAGTTFVLPGATVSYTITAHNSGETAYHGATLADALGGVLDDATYDADALATSGVVTVTGPGLTWTGDLALDATVTITYSVTAHSPAAGDKTMVNTVSSDTTGSTCPPASGNPACHSIVAVLTPALSVTSAASVATTVPGAPVTFTLTAANTGQTTYPAAGISVALGGVLDDAAYGGGVSATSGSVAVVGQNLTWSGALAPGDTATITYTVTVDRPVAGNFRLAQTVVSADQGSSCPAAGADPRCTTSVPIATLTILNAADTATTMPTSVVRNTLTLTNAGQVPYVGISVSESFVGTADDATYNGDATASAGSLILLTSSPQIVWTGDLAVGAIVVITGSATVNHPDLGNKNLGTLVTTDTAASNCPSGGSDPACATSVTVLTPALSITKTADTVTTTPGSTVSYTITVTNSGETPYTAATVRDSLDGVQADATYGGGATTTVGTVGFADSTLTWTGDLGVGRTAVITYGVTIDNPDLGGKTLVNELESDEVGSSCPTGTTIPSCTAFVTVLVPVLDIAVAADATTTVPGATVGYTVTVRNAGQTDYLGAGVTTRLAGVLDDAVAGSATATTGTVTGIGSDLTWTGDLAAGATAIITYSVTVADPDGGDHALTTMTRSSAPGSTCGVAAQCTNTVMVLIPGLSVSTVADVATATPGDRVVFTIRVANTGQTPYLGTVVGTSLMGVLDDAGFDGHVSASSGDASYTAPNLSWTGSLLPGATATISYTVTVTSPDPGDKVLSTTVVAPAAGSTCTAGSADAACTTTVTVLVPGLAIRTSAGTPTTTPGAVVSYTVVITNTGQTAYAGAVVEDSLVEVLSEADYNGDAAVVGGGTLAFAGSTLRWTGDLPIGAAATITYSVTVHDPDTGDKQMLSTVTSPTAGSTCPRGGALPSCSALVRVEVPAMVVTKTADATTVTAGGVVHYTVTVANTGETAYAPASVTDPLAGLLDDADYAGDATADVGTVAYADDTLVWTGPLGVGSTATFTYSVTTRYPATGDLTLTNTAFSASAGANCSTAADPRCSATVTVLVPVLTITKTADTSEVVAGGTVRYTISAANTGQADLPVATFSDSLTGVLDDGTYGDDATATSGVVGYANGVLSWTGSLGKGASVLVSYSVTASTGGTGDGILTNRVVSTTPGSTCTPTAGPPCTTSITVAARAITLTDLTSSFLLTGLPDSTVSSNDTVTMTVTTNSSAGYLVTVQGMSDSLTGAAPGNTATIPIGLLGVRETGTTAFQPLSGDAPAVVHQQGAPSAPGGDAVSNDYEVQIPNVPSDTYSATLDYIISAQ